MNTTVDFESDGPAGRAIAEYLNRLDSRGLNFRRVIREEILAEFPEAVSSLKTYFDDEDSVETGRRDLQAANSSTEEGVIRYVGDYALLEHIGTGGMGTVYRARQSTTGRIVAVKLVRNSSPDQLERFRREAQAIANLRHPNIVTLFEAGEHEGEFYYSMDYIENGSLSRAIRRERPTPRQAAEWARSIAGALDYAHSKGVLHRDIKPQNILLDEQQTPLIADFGLAKIMQDGKPWEQSRAIVGTFAYMPPEQAQAADLKLSPASDVYSLGATLYEMLTGESPIKGNNEAAIIQNLVARDPVSPHSLDPEIPVDLATICLKCLNKEPERRYATARDLADDLYRFLQGQPVKARPLSAIEATARWCRREPFIAVSVLLVGFSLLTIAIGFAVAFYREQQLSHKLTNAARKLDSELARSLADQAAIALAADQPLRSSHLLGRALKVLEAAHQSKGVVASELTASIDELERQIRQRLSAQLNAFYPIEQVIPLTDIGDDDSMPLLSQLTETPIKQGVRDSFIGVQFSPNKRFGLVVAHYSTTGDALLYDFVEGRLIASIRLAESSSNFPITFSPANDLFTLHGRGNSIRRWSLATGEELSPLTHADIEESSTVSDLAFLSKGSRIVSTTVGRNTLFLWDARSGKLLDRAPLSPPVARETYQDCADPDNENKRAIAPPASAAPDLPLTLPVDDSSDPQQPEFVDDAELQTSRDGRYALLVFHERCNVFSTTNDDKLEVFVPDTPVKGLILGADGNTLVIFGSDVITTFDLRQKESIAPPIAYSTANVNFYLDASSRTLLAFRRDGTRSAIDLSSGKVSPLPALFEAENLAKPIPTHLLAEKGEIGDLRCLDETSIRVDLNETSLYGRSTAIYNGEQLLAHWPSPLVVPTVRDYEDATRVRFLDVPESLLLASEEYSGRIHKLFHGYHRQLGPRLKFLESGGWLEYDGPSNRLFCVEVVSATVWKIPDHLRIHNQLKTLPIDQDQVAIDPQTLLPIGIIVGQGEARESEIDRLLTSSLDTDRMGQIFSSSEWRKGDWDYLIEKNGSTVWRIGIREENEAVIRAFSYHRQEGLRFKREYLINGNIKSANALPNGRFLLELGGAVEFTGLKLLDIEHEAARDLEVRKINYAVDPDAPDADRYDGYSYFPVYLLAKSSSVLYFRDRDYQVSVLTLEGEQLSKLPIKLTQDQAVLFDAAARHLAVQDRSLKLSIYDLNDLKKPVLELPTGPEIRTRSFSPSGLEFFLADDQGHVSFVNLQTGDRKTANWKYGWQPPSPYGYRWLNETRMLTNGGVSRLRDTESLLPIGQSMLRNYRMSPDGQVMVNDDSEGRPFLWDVRSGQMLGPPLPIDAEYALFGGKVDYQFSADSQWLYILDKGFIRKHPVPAPIAGSAKDIQLQVELLTGTTMDDSLTIRGLDGHEWQHRKQLQK